MLAHSHVKTRAARLAKRVSALLVAFALLLGAQVLVTPARADDPSSPVTIQGKWADSSGPVADPSVGVYLVPDLGDWAINETGPWNAGISDLRRAVLSFQWLRNGASLPNATAFAYVPGATDLHQQIAVTVTATLDGVVYSTTTDPVEIGPGCFCQDMHMQDDSSDPRSLRVGTTLFHLSTSSFGRSSITSPFDPNEKFYSDEVGFRGSPTYQWRRDGVAIRGATTRRYRLQPVDVGRRITVDWEFAAPGYTTVTGVAGGYVIDPGLLRAGNVKVTGRAKVGLPLTASPGTWSPSGVAFTYQWLRSGKAIAGATKATYRPTSRDHGKRLAVRVTGTKSGYVTTSVTSASTSAVQAGTITVTRATKLTGTAKVGKRLTATKPKVSVAGVTYSYTWLRNGRPIAGATKSSYLLKKADKGKRIQVKVTVKRAGYTTVSSTSPKRGPVA